MQLPNIITYIPQKFNVEHYKETLLHYAVEILETDITEDYDISKTIEYFNHLKEKGSLELYDIMTKGDCPHFNIIEAFVKDNFKFFFCGHSSPDHIEIHNISARKDFAKDEVGTIAYYQANFQLKDTIL